MRGVAQDVEGAVRVLVRKPKFALAAVATLAIGLGATTALFTVLKGVVLAPLPYEGSDRLVKLDNRGVFEREPTRYFSRPDFLALRDSATLFEGVASYYDYSLQGLDLTGGDRPRRVLHIPVSADYFDVLRCQPILGRGFTRQEERAGERRAVVSHRLWREHLDSDPEAVGKILILDRQPWTVTGVLPPDFAEPFGRKVDVWTPADLTPGGSGRDNYYLSVVARLRPGVSMAAAKAELDGIVANIDQEHAGRDPWRIYAEPLREAVVGGSARLLYVLFAAVGLVLLAACVNVATLTLVRGMQRERELAVRSALGCGRGRLIRQLMAESLVLAAAGGIAGLGLGLWCVTALLAWRPPGLPRLDSISLDPAVLSFAAGLTLITALVFGIVPALRLSRPGIEPSLRETGRSASGGTRHRRLRGSLVVAQMGMAFVVLVSATLVVRSHLRLSLVDPGFRSQGIATFQLGLPVHAYPVEDSTRRLAFDRELRERLQSLPGVEAVGAVSRLPLTGRYHSWGYTIRSESEAAGEPAWHLANVRVVSGSYFEALEIPVLQGRGFLAEDRRDAPRVALISRSLAERWFADRSPVGEQLRWGADEEAMTVVGVVGDVRVGHRERTPDYLYVPYRQLADNRPWSLHYVVAAAGDLSGLMDLVRRELASVDPDLVPYNETALLTMVQDALSRERFAAALMIAFAVVALMLAVLGVYAVTAYSVGERLRELGIRLALGARRHQLAWTVLAHGLGLALGAVFLGALAAPILTRWIGPLLFEVELHDSTTLIGGATAVTGAALLACLLPAVRAARADAASLLRSE